MEVGFEGRLWEAEGNAAWVFVTLPHDVADDIADRSPKRPGFGSVPVEVTIGGTTWRTSLFPDKRAASFVLPVKRAVRTAEGLVVGDVVPVSLDIDADRLPPS